MIEIMEPWIKEDLPAISAGDMNAANVKTGELAVDSREMDITPQLTKAACNVISQYCDQQEECYECAIYQACAHNFCKVPNAWVRED